MQYGQLARGSARQGNYITYMNGLIKSLKACDMYNMNLEDLANDRNSWRQAIKKGVQIAEEDYQLGLREKYLRSRETRYTRLRHP